MPSRQERRKAERDAAKRAPAQAGAVGAAGAAAALANLNVNPLGDWTTQLENPSVGPGGYCMSLRGFKVRWMTGRAITAWPYSSAMFQARGSEVVKRMAGEGDREAQWGQGVLLMNAACAACGGAGLLGAAATSPQAQVGLVPCTDTFLVAHHTEMH